MAKRKTEKDNIVKIETIVDIDDKNMEIVPYKQVSFNLIEVILIMIITLTFGMISGGIIGSISRNKINSEGNNVSIPSELSEFYLVYQELKNNYYDMINDKELLDAGIKGMIDYLGDPYTNFMNKEETQDFNERVDGEYVGIGVQVAQMTDGRIIFQTPFENSPALKAGLLEKDQIVKVDNKDINGLSLSEVSSLIKGKKGTIVKVGIIRDGKELSFDVTRDKVEIDSVYKEIIEKDGKKIGVISVSIFAANTYDQFKNKLEELQKENITSLVIDVRGNSGGHLSVVENMVSLFVGKGKILYQLETKGIKQPVYSSKNAVFNLPVVVLTNKGSASASEILAGALKESYGATIVGESTFGKGTVQTTKLLASGATIKYTIQKWLTPNGNWVNEVGIKPDVEISLDKDFYKEPTLDKDNQLQEAINILLKK